VGGNAQIKNMKKVAGTLKLDQAQYRELEAFAKFGSDLDAATKAVLDKGIRNVEILKQNLASPLTVEKQIAIIYLGTNNLMKEIPVNKVRAFQEDFFNTLENSHKELLDSLSKKALDEVAPALVEVANHVMKNYMN
jgi:F-type H+-transporting ATPase subunit alpha